MLAADHPSSDSVADALARYVEGINTGDYRLAFDVRVDRDDAAAYVAFADGNQTSTLRDYTIAAIRGDGPYEVDVSFESLQDPAFAADSTGECTSWELTYEMVEVGEEVLIGGTTTRRDPVSCVIADEGEPSPDPADGAGDTATPAPLVAAVGPQVVLDFAEASLNLGLGTAICATLAVGSPSLNPFGTVSDDAAGARCPALPRPVSHSTDPSDRLVLVGPDGTTTSFSVTEFDASAQLTAQQTLALNHSVAIRSDLGGSDSVVTSRRFGNERVRSVVGDVVVLGGVASAEVESVERSSGETSLGGSEQFSTELISGSLRTGNVTVAVSERREFEIVCADECVNRNDRIIDNRWTVSGADFVLQGALNRTFTGGRVSEVDRWLNSRVILYEDGRPIGGMGFVQNGSVMELVLETEVGRETLGRWR